MITPKVEVEINGTKFHGWDSITINKSMDSLCGTFTLSLYNPLNVFPLGPGQAVSIYIDSYLFFTGYIYNRKRSGSARNNAFTISGREKTSSLIDCSAVHKTGVWNGFVPITKIIDDLCAPFGIHIKNPQDEVRKTKNFALDKGETVHSVMDRLSRMFKFHMSTATDGNLLITKIGEHKTDDSIQYGRNIESYNESIDVTDRYSTYSVQSQSKTSEDDEQYWSTEDNSASNAVYVVGSADDPFIKDTLGLYRPLITTSQYMATKTSAVNNAEWESIVRAARSINHSIGVKGWYQETGAKWLWEVNYITRYINPMLGIDDDFLISSAEYLLSSESGTSCSVTLVDPLSYNQKPLKDRKLTGKKSASNAGERYWEVK